MLKKIWQSFVSWFRKLFGLGKSQSRDRLATTAELPPLDDTDREYLFMQLLEGVAHGWQQPRAIGFFNKIRQRVRKSEWLEWLDRFGNNLLNAPVPNYELAGRMVQLGQLDCGEIGDLAEDYGVRLLNRQAEEFPGDFLPIMEFSSLESAGLDEEQLSYGDAVDEHRNFGEVPLELLIDNDPIPSPPPRSIAHQSEAESPSETREITLEEFSAMLYKDPDLVAELAEQFGIETSDPQVIVTAVVAQMQQQVQQISGDLNPTASQAETPAPTPIPAPSETPPATPPEIPPTTPPATPPLIPEIPPTTPEMPPVTPPVPPEMPPATPSPMPPLTPEAKQVPPPPPLPKLEYKPEDPWNSSNLLGNNEQAHQETAKMPDRGV